MNWEEFENKYWKTCLLHITLQPWITRRLRFDDIYWEIFTWFFSGPSEIED